MGKKHKHPEHENHERWLVSYADFITLLFATFTALYAMNLSDASKMKEVAEAIKEGFQTQSIIEGIKSVIKGKGSRDNTVASPMNHSGGSPSILNEKFDSMTYKPGDQHSTSAEEKAANEAMMTAKLMMEQLALDHATMEKAKSEQSWGFQVSLQERGIKISFDSSLLFDPGSAVLTAFAKKALDLAATRLHPISQKYLIHVEGHTDNAPIYTAIYPSNWELSSARACSVVRYLIRAHHFNAAHLAAVGYGDSRPVGDNDLPKGRSKNRRIDIILYNGGQSAKSDPTQQNATEKKLMSAEEELKNRLKMQNSADTALVQQDTQDNNNSRYSVIEDKIHFQPIAPKEIGKISLPTVGERK